ncbi:YwmB family TATA-box binding protein [Caldisalinibacter kiritimatiensis]|uniref:TATA-box binding protein n=1 Tax=Caldisalinibacter kiritimatiensis TaxID=1304284 RepID=R1CAV6_9FIRM|nr:YwmB family TATA-box binding protein [Caldisalinibacter kiritimatiensis]EOC99444.1 hypothetical protein L21TH_2519 [Caldisalinibacter kiritimatiensis]
MNKLKTITLIGLIIVLSIINFVWADKEKVDSNEALKQAFVATKAEILELNINGSGKINDKYVDKETLKDISNELIKELQVNGYLANHNQLYDANNKDKPEYKIEIVESKDMVQLILWGKDKENRAITAIISTYKDSYSNIEETDLVIDIVQDKIDRLNAVYNQIEKIFNKFNANTKITTCIVGTYDGKLKEKENLHIINEAIQVIKGKKIEGLVEPSLISISAYSPLIDDYIYTADKRMNLNIAMRYNEYEDKTYIWIGSPIIAVGY